MSVAIGMCDRPNILLLKDLETVVLYFCSSSGPYGNSEGRVMAMLLRQHIYGLNIPTSRRKLLQTISPFNYPSIGWGFEPQILWNYQDHEVRIL